MKLKILSVAVLAVAPFWAGCATSFKPLKTTEAPRALAKIEPLAQKVSIPVTIMIQAPEFLPTLGGKNTYPLRQYVEQAFKDAAGAAFADTPAGSYAYTLNVTALSSELRTPGKKSTFKAEFNMVLRNPDHKVLENLNFKSSMDSSFDKNQVPDSVWAVSYQAANHFLSAVRKSRWLKGATMDMAPLKGNESSVNVMAMVQAATRQVLEAQKTDAPKTAAEKPKIVSDIDNPRYTAKENPNNYALVIGIEKYANIPDASFAEHDADAVKKHLLALGYPERNVIAITGQQAVRSSIVKYVETWLPRNLTEDSRLFVYFSGHGAPDADSGQAYILPWEADPQFLENTAYPIKRLYEKLGQLPAKEIIVAMDSCFSGAGGRSVIAKGLRPLVTNVDIGKPSGKIVVFAAANGDEVTGTESAQGHGNLLLPQRPQR